MPSIQSLPGKLIHVTLPSGNTINLTTIVAKKDNAAAKEITEPRKYLLLLKAGSKILLSLFIAQPSPSLKKQLQTYLLCRQQLL